MRIHRKQLSELLAAAPKTKGGPPILGTVFLGDGVARVTDLQTQITLTHSTDQDNPRERFCIPIAELKRIIKIGKGNYLTIYPDPDGVEGWLGVEGVRIGGCFDPDEYPYGPTMPPFAGEGLRVVADPDRVATDIVAAAASASTDAYKKVLNGVFFDSEVIAGTDGHRMALAPGHGGGGESLIIPAPAIKAANRLFKGTKKAPWGPLERIVYGEGRISFEGGAWSVTACELEGTYPDWFRVVPDVGASDHFVGFELNKTLDQCAPGRALADSKYCAIRFECNGTLQAKMENPGSGTWEAELRGDFGKPTVPEGESDDWKVGFNGKYLADAAVFMGEGAANMILGPGRPIDEWSKKDPTVRTGPGTVTRPGAIAWRDGRPVIKRRSYIVMPMTV